MLYNFKQQIVSTAQRINCLINNFAIITMVNCIKNTFTVAGLIAYLMNQND